MLGLALIGLGVAAAVVWRWLWGCGRDRIRYAGTLLQVAGFITVWLGIDETRQLFEYTRSFIAFWEWLSRCPWRGPRIVDGGGAILAANMRMRASASAKLATQPVLTTEQRLDALTKRVGEMEEAHAAEIGKVREILNRIKDALGRESVERMTTTELLKRAQTGGLDLSLAGLVWLADSAQ
jgi:hypothetical protein